MEEHAAILIKDEDNKFLFIKRSKHKKSLPNIWSFPSGTKEVEEDINETAVREAYEELGVQVKTEHTLLTKELPELGVKLLFIVCTITSGEPVIKAVDEIEEIKWLTFSQFFENYSDTEIGHGLIFLRKNPPIWREYS